MTTDTCSTPSPTRNTPHKRDRLQGPQTSSQRTTTHTELVLIRGLPGSGKSTMARVLALVGYQHFEADMFFMRDGVYCYDRSRIREAHARCQQSTLAALQAGKRTVVSNTFTQRREMEPYLAMSRNVRIVEATGAWENVHGVPEETLRNMAARWEEISV